MSNCPCGIEKDYAQCCEIIHNDHTKALTAESLMRARYSAFVKNRIDFVAKTHSPGTSDFDEKEAEIWATSSDWKGLKILDTKDGQENDPKGFVEFKAFYANKDKQDFAHHEKANFEKIDGLWFYKSGEIVSDMGTTYKRDTPKIGRNDPCICGSGKKFKKCCGR